MPSDDPLACPACSATAFHVGQSEAGVLALVCHACGDDALRLGATLQLHQADPPPDLQVLDRLKTWRAEEAARRSVPRYVVLPNRTVEELARRRPATLDALQEVPGIGPKRLDRLGETLLELVDEDHPGTEEDAAAPRA